MTKVPSLGPRGEGWVVAQLLLATVVLLSTSRGPAWGGVARWVSIAVGLGLAGVGAWLAARGAVDLGRSLTPLPRPRAGGELVRSGVYGAVRHPIYGGLLLVHAGLALLSASAATVLLLPATAAFLAVKSGLEERWLEDRFPDYPAYRRSTRRFLPGVW